MTREPGRQRVSTGTVWEQQAGYSRAVRTGNAVFVSGTTATTRDGQFVGEGDAELQARQILDNIRWALDQAGASIDDVVRYRVYVVREEDWPAVVRALADVFAAVRPTSTLVGVSWLVDPRMLVEIEVDAVIDAGGEA